MPSQGPNQPLRALQYVCRVRIHGTQLLGYSHTHWSHTLRSPCRKSVEGNFHVIRKVLGLASHTARRNRLRPPATCTPLLPSFARIACKPFRVKCVPFRIKSQRNSDARGRVRYLNGRPASPSSRCFRMQNFRPMHVLRIDDGRFLKGCVWCTAGAP